MATLELDVKVTGYKEAKEDIESLAKAGEKVQEELDKISSSDPLSKLAFNADRAKEAFDKTISKSHRLIHNLKNLNGSEFHKLSVVAKSLLNLEEELNAELEKQANTRDMNLDADSKESNIETASDVYVQDYNSSVNISNVTKDDVGTDKDDAVEMGTEMADQSAPKAETQSAEPVETPAPVETPKVQQAEAATMPENSSSNEPDSVPDDYEDLPF
jgi:hypothetical protein